MENSLSLRSLEGIGRSPGTGRPSSPSSQANPDQASTEARLERRARREDFRERVREERRSQRAEERRRARSQRREAEAPRPRPTEQAARGPAAEGRAGRDGRGPAEATGSAGRPAQEGSGAHAAQARDSRPSTATQPSPGAAATPPFLASGGTSRPASPVEAPFQGPLGGSETAGGSPLAGLAPALAATPETAPAPGVAPGTSAAPGGANAEGGATTGAPERVAVDGTSAGATARAGDPATAAASAARGAEPPATVEAPSEGRPANGARSQESAAPNTDRAAEVMRQVRMELAPGMRSAVVHLSPPELGRIHIRIRFHKDQLSAVVRAEHAETLDALERHLPELRAVLAQQGIEAGELDLGLGFSEDAPRGEPFGSSSRQTSTPADAPATSLVLPRELAQQAAALDGGIDTYA